MAEEEIIEAPEEEISLREELENAFKEADEKKADKPEQKEEKSEKEEKPRSGDGKFTPKETVVAKPVEAPVAAEKRVAPPNTWTTAAKAEWEKIPPTIQAEIAKRESEVEKGFTKLDEERSVGKTFKETIMPYEAMIRSEGGTPITAIKELLNTAYLLRTATPQAKGQMLMQLAQQFGADFSQVSQGQVRVDPQLQAIQSELQQLKNARQQELSEREQQEKGALQTQIDAFASDPKNIHFETVKAHMAALLKSGLATDLNDAYDQAVYARPDIRSTLLQAQEAEKEAKRVAEAKAKADAARRAGSSLSGSPGATVPVKSNGAERSLREELEANLSAYRNG